MIDAGAWIFLLVQIFFVDLMLGADNVVVIALACGRLRPEDARRAVIVGAAGAIALRLVMLLFANALLDVPLVKLIGAWTLTVIALNVRGERPGEGGEAPVGDSGSGDVLAAAAIIMLADAAMSLDNVVALAAIAGGNFWLLAAGVLMSIPILAAGSLILTRIIGATPEILTLGAVILGWIAGGMAVSDPLVAGWIQLNAPALALFAPALTAAFVWIASRGAQERRARQPLQRERALERMPLTIGPPTVLREQPVPAVVAERSETAANVGWSEERVVVVGFVVLAALAGLIIFVASFLDSLT